MRHRLPDLVILLVLFCLPLGFFWPQTLGGRTLIPTENLYQFEPWATYAEAVSAPRVPHNHLLSDLILQNYQWKHFTRQQLASGEIPLWNPHQFGGIPFLAAGQHSMLYPLSALYLVLDLPTAYGWFTVLSLWLAGGLMFGLARGLGLSRGAGLLAGIVYQLSGFVLASAVFPMMLASYPWLPLLLWMAELIIRAERRRLWPTPIGALALGLNILGGHAEMTVYTLLILAYWSAGRLVWAWWRGAPWRELLGSAAALIALVALGFVLGAAQFVPLFEFARSNWRAERSSLAAVLSYAHPPRDLIQFILPNFYGNPAHHGYLNVLNGQWIDLTSGAFAQPHTEWGIKNYVEGALYLGIAPLALAGLALLDAWRQRRSRCDKPPYRLLLALLSGASLSFMFGLPTYALLYALPTINQLNSPFRWIFGLTLAVALLAGFGLDAAHHRPEQRRRLGLGLVSLGGLIGLGLLASRLVYGAYPFETLRRGLQGAEQAFALPEHFYSYQFWNVGLLVLALLSCGAVLAWGDRLKRSPDGLPAWQILLAALVSADLMAASWGFNPASDPALLDFAPPTIQFLQANARTSEGVWRFITLDDPTQRPLIQANAAWRYGLYDLRGYDSIIPADSVAVLRDLAPQVQLDFNRIAPLYTAYPPGIDFDVGRALESELLARLAVRWIVTHRSTVLHSPSYRLAHEDEAARVWENTRATSRDTFSPDGAAPVGLIPRQDTGRERLLDVESSVGGQLISAEFYQPGWRAFVRPLGASEDEEQVAHVERSPEGFIAVALAAGQWTVRLVYSPTSFQVGLFGSLLGASVLALLAGMAVWRAIVGVSSDQASTTARVARNSIAPILLNVFNRGIDFAFLLVMLRILSPEEVGVYYYLVVIFVWFDILTNFGLDLYVIREVGRDKAQAWRLFYHTSALRFGLSVLGVGPLLGFVAVRQATVTPPLDSTALLTLSLLYLGLFPASLSKGMSALFYAHEQAEKPAAIATITTLNKVAFGLVALLLGAGITGLAAVSVGNNLLTLAVLLLNGRGLLKPRDSWRLDWGLQRRMIGQSWPLLLNHFLATIFFQSDVVLLEAARGPVTVAHYSVGYRWLMAVNIVPSYFTQALLPLMSRQAQEDRDALWRTYRFGIKLMAALAWPVTLAFTLLATVLTRLMGGEQYLPDGALALQIMSWSMPIGWMNSLTQYALVALDMQRRITTAFVLAVTFNLVGNALFIPQYGFVAAAVTTILSELVLFIPFALLMREGLGRPIGWWDLTWRPVVAALPTLALGFALPDAPLLALSLGGVAYLGLLAWLRPLDEAETAVLRQSLRRPT
ncbi:MAG: oligosaccharide flippase family protein [Anaerolineae bacterium]|nr:oligosaccharide flippase family protein [Anaerolineae bacterium]MDW8172663.1 oligosaccharide flippase family protein [Anaerolineae bacterium]